MWKKNLAYALVGLGVGWTGTTAFGQYTVVKPLQTEIEVHERNSKEIRDRLGKCYSGNSRSYVINPDMTVTVWDRAGDRKIRLSDIEN